MSDVATSAGLRIAVTDTRYGPMRYYRGDEYIGSCLARYGEYSEAEPRLWRKLVKWGDTVLDIGANIGCSALPLARMVGPDGRVDAFEAHPENYALLADNCAPYKQIKTWNVAVGSAPHSIHVEPLADQPHTNFGGIELREDNAEGIRIPVVTIDQIMRMTENAVVHFMKIDVEGWEPAVIHGAMDTIEAHRPILYVENDRNTTLLASLFVSLNYTCVPHHPLIADARNFKGKPVTKHFNVMSRNMLCVPDERAVAIAKGIFR